MVLGFTVGRNPVAWAANFGSGLHEFWRNAGWSTLHPVQVGVGGPIVLVNLLVILAVVQTGSLFSADAWNNITFTAGEVKNPKRNIPLSLVLGTGFVLTVYFLASAAYLLVLPMHGDPHGATVLARGVQYAAEDRVGTATLEQIFPAWGALLMAGAILISTVGRRPGVLHDEPRRIVFQGGREAAPEVSDAGGGAGGAGGLGGDTVHFRVVWATPGLHCLCGAVVLHTDYRWSLCVACEEAQRAEAVQGFRLPISAGSLHCDGGVDLYRIIAIQATVHLAGLDDRFAWHSCVSFLVEAAQERVGWAI